MNDPWNIFETLARRGRLEAPPSTDIADRVLASLEGRQETVSRPMLLFTAFSIASAAATMVFAFHAYDLATDPLLLLFNPGALLSL